MKSWSDPLTLSQPLLGVTVARVLSPAEGRQVVHAEALQAAYERGRHDGESGLSQQLLQQRAEMQELIQGVLRSLQDSVPRVVHDTEQMLLALALEVAQKLVSGLPISAPMVEAAVKDALAQAEGATEFTIRLHPDDLELLRSVHSTLLATADSASDLKFQPAPEVSRGGCLVETRFGVIDARRATKFELLQQEVLS
jgi:flagellar assembly protein FliH